MITFALVALIALLVTLASYLDSMKREMPCALLRHLATTAALFIMIETIDRMVVNNTLQLIVAVALITVFALMIVYGFGYYTWDTHYEDQDSLAKRLGFEHRVPGDTTSPLSLLVFVVIYWLLLACLRPHLHPDISGQASLLTGLIISVFALRLSRLGLRYYQERYAFRERTGGAEKVFFAIPMVFGLAAFFALTLIVIEEHLAASRGNRPAGVGFDLPWTQFLIMTVILWSIMTIIWRYATSVGTGWHPRVQWWLCIVSMVSVPAWIWLATARNSVGIAKLFDSSNSSLNTIAAVMLAIAYSWYMVESIMVDALQIKAVPRIAGRSPAPAELDTPTELNEMSLTRKFQIRYEELSGFLTRRGATVGGMAPLLFIPVLLLNLWIFAGIELANPSLGQLISIRIVAWVCLGFTLSLIGVILEAQYGGHATLLCGENERHQAYSPAWLNILQNWLLFGILTWITFMAVNSFTSLLTDPVEAIQDVKTFVGLGVPVALAFLFDEVILVNDKHNEDRQYRLLAYPSELGQISADASAQWQDRQKKWATWLAPVLRLYAEWEDSESRDKTQSFGNYRD